MSTHFRLCPACVRDLYYLPRISVSQYSDTREVERPWKSLWSVKASKKVKIVLCCRLESVEVFWMSNSVVRISDLKNNAFFISFLGRQSPMLQ